MHHFLSVCLSLDQNSLDQKSLDRNSKLENNSLDQNSYHRIKTLSWMVWSFFYQLFYSHLKEIESRNPDKVPD